LQWHRRVFSRGIIVMEDARALLDSMMGAGRNSKLKDRKARSFTDDDICRKFMLGLCPHELFKNTKMDIGPCGKHHNDMLKEAFEADSEYKPRRRKWGGQLRTQLKQLLQDVGRRGETNHSRIAREQESGGGAREENKQLALLKEEVSEKIKQAEVEADNGKFDVSRSIMREVELEKVRIDELEVISIDKQKKESICDICGQRVSADEAAEILRTGRGTHTDGKQHLGFISIRAKLVELEDLEAQDKKDGVRTPSPSPVKLHRPENSRRKAGSRSKSANARQRGTQGRRQSRSARRGERKVDDRRSRLSRSRPRGGDSMGRNDSTRRRQTDVRARRNASHSRSRRQAASQSRSPRRKARDSRQSPSPKKAPAKAEAKREASPPPKPRSRSGRRHRKRDSRDERQAKELSPAPPLPPSPPLEPSDQERAQAPLKFVLGLGKLNVTALSKKPALPSTASALSEQEILQKLVQDMPRKAPSPESDSPPQPEIKVPVKFVLGLGKLNMTALNKR